MLWGGKKFPTPENSFHNFYLGKVTHKRCSYVLEKSILSQNKKFWSLLSILAGEDDPSGKNELLNIYSEINFIPRNVLF